MTPNTAERGARHSRSAPPGQGAWAMMFVIAAFMLLAAVPTVMNLQVAAVREELLRARPTRALLTDAHVSLALGLAALRNYIATTEPRPLREYLSALTEEKQAYRNLRPLVAGLGAEVREAYDALLLKSAAWHDAGSAVLTLNPPAARAALATDSTFEESLVAAALLDRALTRELTERENALFARERSALLVTYGLVLIGLVAIALSYRIRLRLRTYAAEAAAGEQELLNLMASKEQLLNGLAHDVKNPLGAIQGHAEILRAGIKGTMNEEQANCVARIQSSVQAAVLVIDSMLNLARLEAGELRLEKQPVDVGALVRDVADQYRGSFETREIGLELDAPAGLPVVRTDPARVGEIVGNLLSNACKYTPAGGRVRVVLRRQDDPLRGMFVRVSVIDNGRGIAREEQSRVFTQFTRVDEGSSASGTGVGLSISRALARRLGGDLTLESEPGKGSAFSLTLPIQQRTEVTPPSLTSATRRSSSRLTSTND